jgi:glycosyltransferase involved in cell wall biosynthesis
MDDPSHDLVAQVHDKLNSRSGCNVVLSYGDLSFTSGYQTRVLGELQFLDSQTYLETTLLVFDRRPDDFVKAVSLPVPSRVHARSAILRFYPEMAGMGRRAPVRIVHAHNLYSAALALSARRLYGYKVILDYHGRIPEEYVYLGKGGEPSRKALERLERWAVTNADHVIAVSNRLRDYLCERYRIPLAKFSVIPCCADATSFHWEPQRRNAQRHALGLEGRFICTHLGSFFEWYEPQLLLESFEQIRSTVPQAHLLVITGTAPGVRDYLGQRLPAGAFSVITATHADVPALLNASDVGFLLLRSSPNIKTSSPAKFSEYLNCGLPVLITPDVGDFSDLVAEQKVGHVVRSGSTIDATFLSSLQSSRNQFANQCVNTARHLTWQAQSHVWSNLLCSL